MTININLLPRAKRKIRQESLLLVVGMALLLGGSYTLLKGYQQALEAKQRTEMQMAEVKDMKQKLQQQVMQANQQAADKPDVARYLELPEVIEKASVPTPFLLDRLGELMPDGSVVTSFEFEGPDKLKVSAKFSTIEEAVSFIKAVETSPYFLMKTVGSVGENKGEASKGFLPHEGDKVASVYSISFELTVKRNTIVSQTTP
jgi:hypothetical protein